MDSLVLANVLSRPTRTLGSVLGIAVGVVLIVVTVGLSRGMLRAIGEREGQVGAELLFQAPGSFGAGAVSAPLSLPVAYSDAIARIEGVDAATPVGRYLRSGARGIGFELIEGIRFDPVGQQASYLEVTGLRIVEGQAPPTGAAHAVVIDRQRATDSGLTIGTEIEILGQNFVVSGIYEPEVGARIKMPLDTLQDLLGAPEKCSWILVGTETPEQQEAVAHRIDERFPGNQIIFTRDIPGLYEQGLPSLDIFLNVVVGLATVISSLVILLAIYTSVTERTREIGILKSLGASKKFIVAEVQKEALLLSVIGLVTGLAAAVLTQAGIERFTTLEVDVDLEWFAISAAMVFLASMIGSLYPAVKAARQDPVEALAYE